MDLIWELGLVKVIFTMHCQRYQVQRNAISRARREKKDKTYYSCPLT